ncbi:MAG: hypothetical protein IJ484_04650, partial [Oscillospiraceae bacterium]|nr:hypothetical protein [Oscillospiraceae bacterium]
GAMFRREMYDQVGGMREDIDADEDWAMWLRYWKIARRIDDTCPDIPRTVSMFGYPSDPVAAQRRLEAYEVYDRIMLADPDLFYTLTPEKVTMLIRQCKQDLAHLNIVGGLEELLNTRSEEDAWVPEDMSQPMQLTAKQLNGLYHALLCSACEHKARGTLPEWLATETIR